jgi:hypothetical protein
MRDVASQECGGGGGGGGGRGVRKWDSLRQQSYRGCRPSQIGTPSDGHHQHCTAAISAATSRRPATPFT